MSPKVAGEADTPDGSPEIVTLIEPENPLIAVADTITCWLLPPTWRLSVPGVTERLKSGAGGGAVARENGISRLCESVPDVPCNTKVLDALEAPAFAVNVIICGVPGVRVSADCEAVTPAGKPVIVADTWPVKPLKAAAETFICMLDPAVKLTAEAGPEIAKSASLVTPVAV